MALRPTTPKSREEQLAERDSAQQDVFLREVDDALRQDQMQGAFKRYGKQAGIAIGVGLLGLAGYLWWDNTKTQAAGERGEQMTLALDSLESGNLAEAEKQLKAVPIGDSSGTDAANRLTQGGIALGKGDTNGAVKLFDAVAADTAAPQPFRDLAAVRSVAAGFDTMDPQQVITRLKPLAVPGNPWFGSAGELVGMAYLKQGKANLAGPLFAAIARDKTVPDSLRRRGRSLAGLLGVDAVDENEVAAEVAGTASSNEATPATAQAPPAAP